MFIVKSDKDKETEVTDPNAYSDNNKENFLKLSKLVKSSDYHKPKFCLRDMKYFVNHKIAPMFSFKYLYPSTQNYGAYRMGDLIFNKNDYDKNYDGGGFNAWDSYNNGKNNPYNLSYTKDNIITENFGTAYPIGSVVYSGEVKERHFPIKQPKSDTEKYPSHITTVAA